MSNVISDVQVVINVQKTVPAAAFGMPALFTPSATQGYKQYTSLDAIGEDFDADSDVYEQVKTLFAQDARPAYVAIITYTDIAAAFNEYVGKPWYFALIDADAPLADSVALSNEIELDNAHMFVAQQSTVDQFELLEFNKLTLQLLKKDGQKFAAALLGKYGTADVGSLNFHDLAGLQGITADSLTATEYDYTQQHNIMAYVEKSNGVAQTSLGKTASGDYIDILMGMHWIKARINTDIQNLLTNVNKLTFDAAGISLLENVVINDLELAWSMGIIDTNDDTGTADYHVNFKSRAELDPSDIANRQYNGGSFDWKAQGAIDGVRFGATLII